MPLVRVINPGDLVRADIRSFPWEVSSQFKAGLKNKQRETMEQHDQRVRRNSFC